MSKTLGIKGFSVVELMLVIIALAIVVGAGLIAYSRFNQKAANQEVRWAFDEQKLQWVTENGAAPACREPFKFDRTPVEISQVTAVLLPGAYRGYSYKPHGGFGVSDTTSGMVEIKMPIDATLTGLTRYFEGSGPDLQYLLSFENDCGIAFRFDHLHTLTSQLQQLAEQTPEPKLNDTRTSPDDNPPRTKFKSGQVIATRVGLPSMGIYGFDFGVYDYRQANEISKDSRWAAVHNQFQSLDWFGVCWFDMLPGDDPKVVKPLSLQQTDTRRVVNKVSDYCPIAPYKTLDFNDGKPTDG